MNAPRIHGSRVGHRGGTPDLGELSEIGSLPESLLVPKSRDLLKPGEAEVSLPPSLELPNAVAPLTQVLGTRLTIDNPAWSGDPVPSMRLLQKTLVARSLELEPDQRADLLVAIELVEKAVQMRLRWQQMRRSEAEMLARLGGDAQKAAQADNEVTE